MMFGWTSPFDQMIGQEMFLCWLSVGTNNIRYILIVFVLTKVRYHFENLCKLVRSRSVFCDWKVGNAIVCHFSYKERVSESAVFTIAIVIAVVGVTGASMAPFAISGAQTIFGFYLGHNNISFVLYRFMCWFGSILVTVIFTSCKSWS